MDENQPKMSKTAAAMRGLLPSSLAGEADVAQLCPVSQVNTAVDGNSSP